MGKGALGASQEENVEVDHAGAIRVSSPSSPVTHACWVPGPLLGGGIWVRYLCKVCARVASAQAKGRGMHLLELPP